MFRQILTSTRNEMKKTYFALIPSSLCASLRIERSATSLTDTSRVSSRELGERASDSDRLLRKRDLSFCDLLAFDPKFLLSLSKDRQIHNLANRDFTTRL